MSWNKSDLSWKSWKFCKIKKNYSPRRFLSHGQSDAMSRSTVYHLPISSFHELMQWRGVRRPSVCLSVCLSACPSVNFCANRFFSQANGWIATKLAHDGPLNSLHPGCAQVQGWSERSRDTSTFGISQKSLAQPFPIFCFPLSIRFYSASQSPNGCEFALWVPP